MADPPLSVAKSDCDVVDLDGPSFLEHDRVPGVRYADGLIGCDEAVWGSPHPA